MRKRTSLAVLTAASAAVATVGLAAPAAQADGYGDTAITKVVVNGGKSVVVGTSGAKKFTVSVTAKDNSGIKKAEINLHGPASGFEQPTSKVTCKADNATTSTCSATFVVDPKVDLYDNKLAGTWYVYAWVDATDGDFYTSEKVGSFKLQRESKLTVNASPEPVKKGKTLTVTGKLTRAHWDVFGDNKWVAHGNQSVKLEFRKKGTKTFTSVKTVKSASNGALKTTVKASVDGDWRFNYAGNTSHSAVASAVDFVDVR
ncbi:calcium-binding protein [Streptomyces sp. SAJ15]|uniref:calcium-binding protein n=1 Tax=Streptomyces sp. SAJ15 TaxID=2011095 RepID=UPI001184926E|nr:calcium-binding protein [Streptomyces sp. SAJ15]TVL89016.1 calcium-binding protein [Streptomyces sp. SAJ15]